MNIKPKTDESKQFLKELSDLLTNHNAEIICEGDEIFFNVAGEQFIGNCWKLNKVVIDKYILNN